MSVDTYLKGKNTSRYTALDRDGVRVLLSPELLGWAASVQLYVRNWLVRKTIGVHVEHRHGPG